MFVAALQRVHELHSLPGRLQVDLVAFEGDDRAARHVDGDAFDHGFEGWKGPARIRDLKIGLAAFFSVRHG